MNCAVYNLEFRSNSHRLAIGDYVFERVPDYAKQQAKLQYLVGMCGLEFSTTIQTGSHAHTANVSGPDNAPPPIIPWQHARASALDDILLLLQLFTNRHVFVPNPPPGETDEPFAIVADPRCFRWGGVLACSIPYESQESKHPYKTIDTSLSVHLPRIYEQMQDRDWQRKYKGGYFLVLVNQAIQQRVLESAFGQCWTIWEHLFACLTTPWLSDGAIQRLHAKEKIAFLLIHFGVRVDLKDSHKSRLDDLVAIRNRLVHFGQFPERDAVYSDAEMFIRMTEFITAKALGLYPSNVFNTLKRFEEFLDKNRKRLA